MQFPANEPSPKEESIRLVARDRRSFLLAMATATFMSLISMVVVMMARRQVRESQKVSAPLPSQLASASPISQAPVLREQFAVEILNASGEAGAAGRVKEELKSRQLELLITTGNTKTQKGTTVSYKSTRLKEGSLAKVIGELYPGIKASVDEQLKVDVQIILGK